MWFWDVWTLYIEGGVAPNGSGVPQHVLAFCNQAGRQMEMWELSVIKLGCYKLLD